MRLFWSSEAISATCNPKELPTAHKVLSRNQIPVAQLGFNHWAMGDTTKMPSNLLVLPRTLQTSPARSQCRTPLRHDWWCIWLCLPPWPQSSAEAARGRVHPASRHRLRKSRMGGLTRPCHSEAWNTYSTTGRCHPRSYTHGCPLMVIEHFQRLEKSAAWRHLSSSTDYFSEPPQNLSFSPIISFLGLAVRSSG